MCIRDCETDEERDELARQKLEKRKLAEERRKLDDRGGCPSDTKKLEMVREEMIAILDGHGL